MAKRTIELQASKFDHHDDCLAAAKEYAAKCEGVEDWQVSARWGDSGRDTITVTIEQFDEDCYRARDARGEGFAVGVDGEAVFRVVDAMESAGAVVVQRAWTDDSVAVVVTPAGRRIGISHKNGPWACYLD